MTDARPRTSERVGGAIAVAVCLAALAPFLGKAFHLDDPLFLWVARQVQAHPLDFYGFRVNWYGYEMPMWEVTKNPPLTSFYIAAVARVVGWSECALHAAFLLPAAAAALGIHALARRLCEQPLLAALAALLTPAFVVSSTNVMSETVLLACWVWATALWIRGVDRSDRVALGASAVLMALAMLTKYFGLALVPLLAAYALTRRSPARVWLGFLAVPLAALAAYQIWTLALYGQGLMGDAAAYAAGQRAGHGAGPLASGVVALGFAGGSLFGLVAFAPLLWSRRALAGAAAAVALAALALAHAGAVGPASLRDAGGLRWTLIAQLAICAVAGTQILALAAVDLWARRDGEALLLVLWVVGTLAFAAFVNWTVNARSILPVAPAVAILLARRLDQRFGTRSAAATWGLLALVIPGAVVALVAARADQALADSARTAAAVVRTQLRPPAGTTWFQGHWGFQLYMEAAGARPMDWRHTPLASDDLVVIPQGNTNKFPLPASRLVPWRAVELPLPGLVATMSPARGAGYYAAEWGPLPLAVGPVPPERYHVYRVAPAPGAAR